ncbi:MAG: signal peptide peptidase SppA, type [Bacteriovoracaceae bacterium]|nr:signal peptide peptidase SppA, type [Bacteriovoracaceae bacterium]
MKKFFKFLFVVFIILVSVSLLGSFYKLFNPEEDYHSSNIGVIEIDGVITQSLPVLEQLEEVRKTPQLKALIVRVDSPGGAVGASQEIYMELKKMRKTLPVIVSMGDIAASGGLYVSMGADVILALPGTLTGSMGVIFELMNFSRLINKVLIDPVTIKSGELKDAGNPTRPLDPKAKQLFQDLIHQTFGMFKNTVTTERKLKPEAVKLLSDGRVVNGEEALKIGLVDRIGTFQDAVDLAKERGKISGKVSLAYLSRKPKSFIHRVIDSAAEPLQGWVRERTRVLQYRWEPAP